ncbi:hypothetical protein NQ318_007906 [Aromia moschata]|uniref:Uncharacterized protein n=1 Tax=Aromia moschata TaxID=1265417 RepID=A0AAV8XVM6_9CUCU|nr:hypothetical protein NQ318_007906 [Aromia moschata]
MSTIHLLAASQSVITITGQLTGWSDWIFFKSKQQIQLRVVINNSLPLTRYFPDMTHLSILCLNFTNGTPVQARTCREFFFLGFQVGISLSVKRCSHFASLVAVLEAVRGSVDCIKLRLDFSLATGGTRRCNGCLVSSRCLLRSAMAWVSLLICGGAIPASMYSWSRLVGFRHPVINLHVSFRTGSSLWACVDLSHTGNAYSAAE